MGLLPWQPDRHLDVEVARSAIQTAFPHVDVARLAHVGSGWEFDVYVTDDGWAFRFPRRSEHQRLFERERPSLALARAALAPDATVPLVELRGTAPRAFPYEFAGHRFIEGMAADLVSPDLWPSMARSIGAALGVIHSVPVAAARAAGVGEMDPPNRGAQEWLRRNLAGAFQLAGSDLTVDRAVAWVSRLDRPLRRLEAPLSFTHADLSPEHLVMDESTGELVGILDWTDASLGDAARDFVPCVTLGGWSFVEQVLSHYPHGLDTGFRQRLRFMARFLSVMWLGEAQQNGGDLQKHLEWVRNAFTSESAPSRTGLCGAGGG